MSFTLGLTGPRLYHRDEIPNYNGPALYCIWLVREQSSGVLTRRQKVGQTKHLSERIKQWRCERDGRFWNYYSYKKAPQDEGKRRAKEKKYIKDLEPYHNVHHNQR